MASLWELLKASKGLPTTSIFAELWAQSMVSLTEYIGTVPFAIESKSTSVSEYAILGDIKQNGTPTPDNPVEVLGVWG